LRVAQVVSLGTEGLVAQARTIGRLWLDAVAANRSTPAFLVERDGEWQPVSWDEAARIVEELANGLLAAGVRKDDAVAIAGQTTLEWALFDFALALVGAIGAPVYANSSAKDAQFVVEHSEAVAALCEDDEQRRRSTRSLSQTSGRSPARRAARARARTCA
jgi:long-subunit acyl-CoA synthetase (AMP-forming)